jgi:hypothetical protein
MSLHDNFGSGNKDANPDLKPNDVIMTPRHIAKQMIDFYDIQSHERVLDPCAGSNAFFSQYPKHILGRRRMEIKEGLDFFDWDVSRSPHIDWIITNPPYSIFPQFLEKCFEVADNVCLLIPLAKLVSSLKRINMVLDYGGIVSMRVIGASKCGFPFGFPAAAIHMKRGYTGETLIEMWPEVSA